MKPGDLVRINTDTVFDEEGVPVSIRDGATGRVVELGTSMTQVLVQWTDGPEILGVPTNKVQEVA
jgi:ribosomal protein L21E